MFPTCSNRLLAGRNALSATDLTISLPAAGPLRRHAEQYWMGSVGATPNRRTDPRAPKSAAHRALRWYVAPALREEIATSVALPRRRAGWTERAGSLLAVAIVVSGLAACGSDAERQDVDEPAGEFPVEVVAAKFQTEQRLAQTSDLTLEIRNSGEEAVPELAVSINTGDEGASGPFSVRSDQAGLADPNRPVWILESGYPKLVTPRLASKDLDAAPTGGSAAVQTNTFSFGSLAPGESREIVWRVTPVQAGTYTVRYELAAGLTGKAKAVTDDGSPVEGEFVVTITDKPPRARVDDAGNVVIQGD